MSTSLPSGTWREPILAQFSRDIASVARLTVVADPDELLTEQGIVDGIRQRGFEIVPFDAIFPKAMGRPGRIASFQNCASPSFSIMSVI